MKKIMKYAGALGIQYCKELIVCIFVIFELVKQIVIYQRGLLEFPKILLINVILGVAFYYILAMLSSFVFSMLTRKNGRILQLTMFNEICMKPKNVRDETEFLSDFEKILAYCRENKIERIYARTHRVLVSNILYHYRIGRVNVDKYLNMLSVGQMNVIDTTFGRMEIIYRGKIINSCNRYNKKIKKWRKRIFKETDGYKIVLYLQTPVSIK